MTTKYKSIPATNETVDDFFPTRYLAAEDLNILGVSSAKAKIKKVTIDEMFNKQANEKETKPVLWFQGKTKGMVLNKTNSMMIASITGTSKYSEWAGTDVVIYTATVKAFGKVVDALRIRKPKQ